MSGVARVFNTKRQLLQTLGNFSKAWSLLLEFVENAALSGNNEVGIFIFSRELPLPQLKNFNSQVTHVLSQILPTAWRVLIIFNLAERGDLNL